MVCILLLTLLEEILREKIKNMLRLSSLSEPLGEFRNRSLLCTRTWFNLFDPQETVGGEGARGSKGKGYGQGPGSN